jgi:uncharacterized protein (DUF1330 family)
VLKGFVKQLDFCTLDSHVMCYYLILARIIDLDLFTLYMKGHLPSIEQYGGKVLFRSTKNVPILGKEVWDAIAMHEWPSKTAFTTWWQSPEYLPWVKIRDQAAKISITHCQDIHITQQSGI